MITYFHNSKKLFIKETDKREKEANNAMKPGSYLLVGVTGLPDRFPKLQKARSFYTARSI